MHGILGWKFRVNGQEKAGGVQKSHQAFHSTVVVMDKTQQTWH